MRLRDELQKASPEFYRHTLGERAPALAACLSADGRVGRQTPAGFEWVTMLAEAERAALLALVPKAGFVRDEEGSVISGFVDSAGRGQLRVAVVPSRRLGADDFAHGLQPELFFFLQSLVRLGENVWIVGDSGAEYELGAALVPDTHTLLARPPVDRPAPFQSASLPLETSLAEALSLRDQGGFSTLVFDGTLGEAEMQVLGQRSGIVLTERCTSIERALGRRGLLQRQDLAQQLPSLAAVVHLQRSHAFGVQVAEIGEFRRGESGVDYVPIAARGHLSDARILAIVQQPQSMQRLIEAGIDNVVLALSEAAPDDAMNISGNVVVEEEFEEDDFGVDGAEPPAADLADFDDDDDAPVEEDNGRWPSREGRSPGRGRGAIVEIDHDDPGWELDAETPSARSGLVQAPGPAGSQGMFRARPVVRPSTKREEQDDGAVEIGKLTLDPPSRKIMIPEAPSGVQQKRTFAEIMRERHRFPPMSEKGPTLTPPVLSIEESDSDDDITP